MVDTILTSGDDSYAGTADADNISALEGNDTIVASSGNDTIDGGDGIDVLDYSGVTTSLALNFTFGNVVIGPKSDVVSNAEVFISGSGDDTLGGRTFFNDTIDGGEGNDTITNSSGDDSMAGGSGTDWLVQTGSAGALIDLEAGSVQSTQTGNDAIAGIEAVQASFGNDTVLGSASGDTIDSDGEGGDGADSIDGRDGDDSLFAGGGNDTIDGGSGNDTIVAGDGDDVVRGGVGTDSLVGGEGNDIVIVELTSGLDVVTGGGGNDTLDLEGWTGPNSFASLTDGAYGQWTVTGAGGANTVFENAAGGIVNASDLESITCFVTGTLIATARGEVPVEALRVGDLVVTVEGGAPFKPIRWIGRSRVDVARHRHRQAVAPIVIRAGALEEGVPARDLRVSPEHSVLLGGRLVPAHLLVNGGSIVQEAWCQTVTYWHVELDGHGLLVSDGAVTESYLDDDNRQLFDNVGVTMLSKDFLASRGNGRHSAEACRPVVQEGPALDALRIRLAQRAKALGEAGDVAQVGMRAQA